MANRYFPSISNGPHHCLYEGNNNRNPPFLSRRVGHVFKGMLTEISPQSRINHTMLWKEWQQITHLSSRTHCFKGRYTWSEPGFHSIGSSIYKTEEKAPTIVSLRILSKRALSYFNRGLRSWIHGYLGSRIAYHVPISCYSVIPIYLIVTYFAGLN